jgi:hypothetical protein
MKTKLKYLIILTCFIFACSDYLDINQDPSFPQSATAEVLLPPIFQEMVAGETFDSRFVGQYIQNWGFVSANNVWDQHGYVAGNDAGGQMWRSHYWAIGLNVDLIIEDAMVSKKSNYIAVAKAIRAWSWQTTTDYHGEMILDQAWEPNRFVFEYDPQEDIYAEVIRLSNEALRDLQVQDDTKTLVKGDLVYAGDTIKWRKFIYSILARNAHHISNKSNYDPDRVITFVNKSFSSNADNFIVPHLATSTSDANFFGPLRNNMGSYRQTQFALSLMNGTVYTGVVDPRMAQIYTASPSGNFNGVAPNVGDPNNIVGNTQRIPNLWGTLGNISTTGKYIYQNNAGFPIVTYSELQFIKAEAAFIKGDLPVALQAYRNGVQASCDYIRSFVAAGSLASYDAAVTSYLASTAIAQDESQMNISRIMIQKYISLIGHGCLESWVDMRRYHYDNTVYTGFTFPTVFFTDNAGKPAYRIRPRYNSEYVWNRASLDEIGGNNLDYHTYEQWFSKID